MAYEVPPPDRRGHPRACGRGQAGAIMGPMRLGIDCRLAAYRLGGISRYVLHLLPALAALDTVTDYVVGHSRKDRTVRLPSGAPNFHRVDLWTPCHHRLERWALGLELLPRKLDLWHSPDFIPPVFGARRRVITVHDLTFMHFPQFLTSASRRYYADQIAWAVRVADHVLADSRHTRQDLIERLGVPEGKVTAVPLAANPAYDTPPTVQQVADALARFDLRPGFVLHVGTLEPRKNLPHLVKVYARLRRQHAVEAPLVLVGATGWLSEALEATITASGVADHVRHLERVDDGTLGCLYAAAGALALPSHYEGFGLPALEAMRLGCPVVSSDRASLPEVVGDAGLLLPPDDEAAWVETLARVLRDDALRERLAAAGRRQADGFGWAKTAAATLAVYRSLG